MAHTTLCCHFAVCFQVVTRIDSIAASIQAEVGVSAGITEEGAEQKPSRGDLVPIAYSMNKLLKK